MSRKQQFLSDPLVKKTLNTRVFVNTMVAVTLLFIYAFVSFCFLPPGINYVFVIGLCKLLWVPMVVLHVVYWAYVRRIRQKADKYKNSAEGLFNQDLFLLLLPMTPIVRYIILNQDILTLFDSIVVFAIFLAIAIVLTFLVPMAVGKIGSKKPLRIAGLSFCYVLFSMASLASDFRWHLSGNLRIQLTILSVFFTITLVIYLLDKKFLKAAVVVFFAIGTLMGLISSVEIKNAIKRLFITVDKPKIYAYTKGREPNSRPDIFLLTYDSYVENETMQGYGIDNSAQEDHLIKNGFYIYKGTYTVAADTFSSMSRVFDVSSVAHIILPRSWLNSFIISKLSSYPVDLAAVSGNSAVHNILKQHGYETFGIFPSDSFFRKGGFFYDHAFPARIEARYKLLVKQILEGEFRFDAGLETKSYFEYLSKKREILLTVGNKPRFLYAHSNFPGHSQNSGRALGNEVGIFKDRLVKANDEMRIDIETIIKHSPNAIIIINGDHGPYLTKNCTLTSRNNEYNKSEIDRLDIQDRSGSFLAIKWPKGMNVEHDKIKILQDIFPSIFAYLYEDNSILNSRIEPLTIDPLVVSGVLVRDGIIEGGKDDGNFLFDSIKERQ